MEPFEGSDPRKRKKRHVRVTIERIGVRLVAENAGTLP